MPVTKPPTNLPGVPSSRYDKATNKQSHFPFMFSTVTKPAPEEWMEFTEDARVEITRLVKDECCDLDDVLESCSEFGEEIVTRGAYTEWEALQQAGYSQSVVRAFIELEGIEELTYRRFEELYFGQFNSDADAAEEMVLNVMGLEIPDLIEVDWDSTYNNHVALNSHDGFYFNQN